MLLTDAVNQLLSGEGDLHDMLYDVKWNRLLRRSIALVTMKPHDTEQF